MEGFKYAIIGLLGAILAVSAIDLYIFLTN